MYSSTLTQLENFQRSVNCPSLSDAIRRAVEIIDVLVRAIENGDRVIIESKNRKQRQILITGLNNKCKIK